jgi:hypothetical protein
MLEESVAIWRELGERRHQAYAMVDLGLLAIRQGETELGRARLDESLSTFAELDDAGDTVLALLAYADLFDAQNQPTRVLRVLGAMSALMKKIGMLYSPLHRARMAHHVADARRAVAPEIAAAEWRAGELMSLNEAIAYTLDRSAR